MKILSILSKLVLYVVLTFVFIVIFEHGYQAAPSKMVSEFFSLKQEIQTSISNR
ncbi:MAG: hypothetical protein ABIP97_00495 [Chthoniobacterales bacterium]